MSGLDKTTPIPTQIKLHQVSRKLEIAFNDGTRFELPYEFLRVYLSAARGIFHHAAGLMAARAVPGVSDIRSTAQPGQIVAPPPEGTGYLGFIFARAALRAAHADLAIEIQAELPMTWACAES